MDLIESDRFIMKHVVVSHKLNKIAATGEGVLVTFDYKNDKKALIPNVIRDRIIALEKCVGQDVQ